MAELDRFERQLTAAVRGFADQARTEVDAVAVANRAARGRRLGQAGWLGRTVPVPVALLILIGLILLLVATLAAGAWRPFTAQVVSTPAAPSASPTAVATHPAPTPDALGRVHVTGTETVDLQTVLSVAGDSTLISGGDENVFTTTNDVRVNGAGTFEFTVDHVGSLGTWRGTYRLATAGGVWQGSCSGSAWDGDRAAVGTCWLTGSGADAGFTYFRIYSWAPGQQRVEGIVYPGPPPGS